MKVLVRSKCEGVSKVKMKGVSKVNIVSMYSKVKTGVGKVRR